MRYSETDNYRKLELDDGKYLLLKKRHGNLQTSGMTHEEYARNVWLMSAEGKVIWQIKTDRDHFGAPFVYLFSDEDPTLIDRWDSGTYKVNMKTGWAEVFALLR